MDVNKIYNENNLDTMNKMPNEFIDLTVTSPPYDDIRNYNGYSFHFEEIAKELYRVTKEGGVVVWIVGDSIINNSESGTSFKQALYFKEIGFNIHDTMIYEKNSTSYPSSIKSNRYSQIFEYMFVLSKSKPKTYNLLKDKHNKWFGHKSFGNVSHRKKNGDIQSCNKRIEVKEFGYRNNIWKINTGYGHSAEDKIAYNHPAIFPEKLARDHIYSWSNEHDLIYDCFGGSGTTAKAAIELKRNWIISEISSEYCDLMQKRLNKYLNQTVLDIL